MTVPLLTLDGVSLTRGRRRLLDHVSLQLAPGEHVTVVGPNGAGKTLLLRVIAGAIPPDGGTVTRRPGLRLGYMPQKLAPSLLMPMSVAGFLKTLKGIGDAEIRSVLGRVGAERVAAGRSIHALSGGEWQRVLLARALLREPELLLLDEPGQNLDVTGQLALYELIRQVQAESGCAVLMVSHDLHFVMRRTDRVICLFHHVCCTGKPQDIVAHQAFTEIFGDDLAGTLGFYPHRHTHSHGPGEACDGAGPP